MIGTTLNQRFSLEKELGRGGMGAVYRATDQILQRTVAIKVMKDQGREEFSRRIRLEAQILARLLHDNVVRIYDFGDSDGICYLVMEEVDGSSYLKRWKNVPLIERLPILAQVAEALDYAHHQGVIHRDVKPGNVLLTASDQAKLSDFGLSMLADDADETGTIRGTPHYMSPEQARGKRLDPRSDLYSLGVMLYESAAGSVPFSGNSMAVLSQHMNNVPDAPRTRNPDVSVELEALIGRLMDKDPVKRPLTGAVVARLLRDEAERMQSPRGVSAAGMTTVGLVSPPADGPMSGSGTVPSVSGARSSTAGVKSGAAVAKQMLSEILAEPMVLSPDERYLYGHYLAYLLGGARRTGFLLSRPLDPRNSDRARLMLAMTSVMFGDGSEASLARGAKLLDDRTEIRPSLNPVLVAKYLACRDGVARRKKFRNVRRQLQEASAYAQKSMTDAKGVLNPGLMPQTIDDLRKLAPARTEVDESLVTRWNRVAESWRADGAFRNAVLMYATRAAARDPASFDLWPEVAYPLIERARWQRRTRTRSEALLDNLCEYVLHVPDAGVRMDRAIEKSIPAPVMVQLDAALDAFSFIDEQPNEPDQDTDGRDPHAERLSVGRGAMNIEELTQGVPQREKGIVKLVTPEPHRFLLGEIRELWQEAIAALRAPSSAKAIHRTAAIGPYRLAVIPSVRGRSAGQLAIQGMPNKQLEMLTPSMRGGGSASRPIVAAWVYQDNSLAVCYLDFKGNNSYILWHAPKAHQFNYDDPGMLSHEMFTLGLEVPDQLDRVLSKSYRPTKRV